MVDQFLGIKYKLHTSENFDDFMKELGVGLVTRKMGAAATPVVDLQKEGDTYILTSNSTFKNFVLKFKSGEEFDQETPDGRKVKSTITVNGDMLNEVQVNTDGSTTSIDRHFSADELKMVMTHKKVVSTRIYKAIPA